MHFKVAICQKQILLDHHNFDKYDPDEDFDKTKCWLAVSIKTCPRQGYHLAGKAEK